MGLRVDFFSIGSWFFLWMLVSIFLAVVEHRLAPAGVRCESAGLGARGISSVWALPSQESSHVGSADVGVVILRGAP